jgi:hypothetical protein
METFLGTAALAAITALCIIAYRHPKGYMKLADHLIKAAFCIFCVVAGFAIGVSAAQETLAPYVQPPKAGQATQAVAAITPSPWWTTIVFAAFVGFLWFLRALPDILEHHPDEKIER